MRVNGRPWTGEASTLASRTLRDSRDPLAFRTAGLGRPKDVELAPYHRLPPERYNVYWMLARA